MSLTLNTNVSSLITQNWLSVNTAGESKATEQLSSGSKLNSAGDDPAGYAIAFSLGVSDAALQTATNNANQGSAMLQVAQGAMQQIGNILTQLQQLATEASSANNGSNLTSLDSERQALETEINNINQSTTYGGSAVFGSGNVASGTATAATGYVSSDVSGWSGTAAANYTVTATATAVTLTNAATGDSQKIDFTTPTGSNTTTLNFSSLGIKLTVGANVANMTGLTFTVTPGAANMKFQVGDVANTANQVSLTLNQVGTAALGITGDLTSQTDAGTYMGTITSALSTLSSAESSVGNAQNQLSYATANLQTMDTNTQSAESTIKDTDYASSMSSFTKYQIATQAGVAMLSQANQIPQEILSLIKGQ